MSRYYTTFQVFNAFINIGYDDLEVVMEAITEDVLSLEFSTEIPLLGQRKKVALAVRKAKEKQGKSNNTAVGDKPKAGQSFSLSWTDKAPGEPWKKNHWAISPGSPKGERSIAYMELLPKFYKADWPYCNSDSYFRKQFITERSRQYETDVKVAGHCNRNWISKKETIQLHVESILPLHIFQEPVM